MGSGTGALRGLFVAIMFLGFTWFVLVGILANQAVQSAMIVTIPSSRNFKMEKLIERERHIAGHRDSDFNYASKESWRTTWSSLSSIEPGVLLGENDVSIVCALIYVGD
ncbi:hypothetical protein RJ641_006856 [Dillenia turbinata]|uniref:Uncharacterized protein n=1 Tax=Dillenia turbinata TaxID=194707 RepID=A0AAN8V684_9MAGN